MLEHVVALKTTGCTVEPLGSLGRVYEPVPVSLEALLYDCLFYVHSVQPGGFPPYFLVLFLLLGTVSENTNA